MNNTKQGFARFAESRNKTINMPDDKPQIGKTSINPLGKKISFTKGEKQERRYFFDKTSPYKFTHSIRFA